MIPYQQMVKNVADARIVITHGGPASFVMPLQIGKTPIVVPRQHQFDEHVNDHQVDFSRNVAQRMGTIILVEDVVNQGMQEKQSITVRCVDIEDLEKQAEAIRVEQIKLYESYADGVLRRDVYIEKKKTLSEKLAALQDSIRTEKEEQECADELDEEIRNLTKQASQKTYIGGLTKECVDAFVSMVYLYDDQTMKVEFNCEDVIRRALEKYGA